MQQGQINVQTENIFPIIKKFLYSDHEIFLRELVSNAVDATQKRKALLRVGEIEGNADGAEVHVILDSEAKTLTIRDAGIGMSEEEVDKYINQIAFSGATEFVEQFQEKYADKADAKEAIIGHFGLGFYSAFMVAERVDIYSWSQRAGAVPVKWTCDGSPNFEMGAISEDDFKALGRAEDQLHGTDIVLHLGADGEEFGEETRIMGILEKYCKFMPVPVVCGTKTNYVDDPEGAKDDEGNVKRVPVEEPRVINETEPIWLKAPADLKDEDYLEFYRTLYPMNFEEPLFQIHLNVDFPFNLTGVLYFPKLKKEMDLQRNKIHLYSNQVFITDNVENIVPDFLTLLHGVIDSPDIPLNVSRSYLQEDANVKKITSHISKKVSDKLAKMFKDDREDFAAKWNDIQVFTEYGMLMDEKFFERAGKFALYQDTEGAHRTMDELVEHIKDAHTDKDGNVVMLYTPDPQAQHSYVAAARDAGYTVLHLESPLTSHLVQKLEMNSGDTKVQFRRVDADIVDRLIPKEDAPESVLTEDQQTALKEEIEAIVPDKMVYKVAFAPMSPTAPPITITQSEFMRRMKEQQRVGGGGMAMFGDMPDSYDVVFNANHPLVTSWTEGDAEARKPKVERAIALARLSQGLLQGEELTQFIASGYADLND